MVCRSGLGSVLEDVRERQLQAREQRTGEDISSLGRELDRPREAPLARRLRSTCRAAIHPDAVGLRIDDPVLRDIGAFVEPPLVLGEPISMTRSGAPVTHLPDNNSGARSFDTYSRSGSTTSKRVKMTSSGA